MKILFVVLIVFTTTHLQSQVNIESLRKELDDTGFSGLVNLSLSIQTGSVDKQELSGNAQINYSQPSYYSLLIVEESLGWLDGNRFSNSGLAHLRFVYRTKSIFNPETFIQGNYNKERKLLERYLVGAGVRMNLLSSENKLFSIGVAAMYESEKFDVINELGQNPRVNDWRGSSYLSLSFFLNNDLRISKVSYYQPRLDNFSDFRILNNTQMSFTLFDPIVFNLTFNLLYDSEPVEGVVKLDTRTRFGLGVRF